MHVFAGLFFTRSKQSRNQSPMLCNCQLPERLLSDPNINPGRIKTTYRSKNNSIHWNRSLLYKKSNRQFWWRSKVINTTAWNNPLQINHLDKSLNESILLFLICIFTRKQYILIKQYKKQYRANMNISTITIITAAMSTNCFWSLKRIAGDSKISGWQKVTKKENEI